MWLAALIIILIQCWIAKVLYKSKASVANYAGFCVYKNVCFLAALNGAFCVFFAAGSIILISRTKGCDELSMIADMIIWPSYAGLIFGSGFILFLIKVLESAKIHKDGQNNNSSNDGSSDAMRGIRRDGVYILSDEAQH